MSIQSGYVSGSYAAGVAVQNGDAVDGAVSAFEAGSQIPVQFDQDQPLSLPREGAGQCAASRTDFTTVSPPFKPTAETIRSTTASSTRKC